MLETELKFQVPPAQRDAVRRRLQTPTARTLVLRACYFDTADRRLAAAGMALRLRLEGRSWVQTLKLQRGTGLHRLEHEVALGAAAAMPALDPARHDGSEAGAALGALLADGAPLQPVFDTDIRRVQRLLRSGGAAIEVALDIGELRAGGRALPVHEIEFELKQGPLPALFAAIGPWVDRYGLWLDVRSKAERGELLARGQAANAPTTYRPPALQPAMPRAEALRVMVDAALRQVLPNAAVVATTVDIAVAGAAGEPEHLHQLRIGLRRLRSVLRLYGTGLAGVNAGWPNALAQVFRGLGGQRDRDMLQAWLLPQLAAPLAAAGAPPLVLPAPPAGEDPGAALRTPACTQLLLALLAFTQAEAGAPDGPVIDHADLAGLLRPPLKQLQRQLRADARGFLEADDAARHRARRRLKRLRYGVEAAAALFPPRRLKRYLARLRPVQEALGEYTDLLVAQAALGGEAGDRPGEPGRWFALGWLAAQHERLLRRAAEALAELPRLPAGR